MLDLKLENKKLYKNLINDYFSMFPDQRMSDLIQKPLFLDESYAEIIQHICPFCSSKQKTLFISNFQPVDSIMSNSSLQKTDSLSFQLRTEVDNKIVICQDCIQYKRTRFEYEDGLLINPLSSRTHIQKHFFYDSTGEILGFTPKADATIDAFGLNRKNLVTARENIFDKSYLFEEIEKKEALSLLDDLTISFIDVWRQRILVEDDFSKKTLTRLSQANANAIISESNSLRQEKKSFILKYQNEYRISEYQKQYSVLDLYEKPSKLQRTYQTEPFMIESIQIKKFKQLSSLTIDIYPTKGKTGQWLCLLGENGAGKTSLLQAIALTLVPKKERWHNLKRINRSSEARQDNWEVDITSRYSSQDRFSFSNHRDPDYGFPLVIAYGSTRLSDGLYANRADKNFSIRNLFNPRKSLENPEKFLLSLSTKSFYFISKQISEVFPKNVTVSNDNNRIIFHTKEGNRSFSELSDGYKIILALVTDIMSTLSKVYQSYEGQAVVLIDEIENHLHPKWIIELPSILKRVFPYVQFITTSHNPLSIRQLNESEVIRLENDKERGPYAIQATKNDASLASYSIDRMLTSSFFGLLDTNPQANRELERFYTQLKNSYLNTDSTPSHLQILSSEDQLKFSKAFDFPESYAGSQRDYYYQYLIDQLLIREKNNQSDQILKTEIMQLAERLLEEENE